MRSSDPALGPNLRSGTVSNSSPAFTWNGRDASGARVPDGAYRVTLWAEDASANRSGRGFAVTVDNRPATLGTGAGSGFITPDADGRADTVRVALERRPGHHRHGAGPRRFRGHGPWVVVQRSDPLGGDMGRPR